MEKVINQFQDKLCRLLFFLKQLPVELENIADEVDNENLREALFTVATESSQYENELKVHLHTLDIYLLPVQFSADSLENELVNNSLLVRQSKGEEIHYICEKSEQFFTRLYNDAINELMPGNSLLEIMNYQLLGIRSAFLRLRFLNTLRFHN